MGSFALKAIKFALLCLSSLNVVSSSPDLITARNNTSSGCPAFDNGTFVINQFQLYPENAKFDPVRCLVYFGYVTPSEESIMTMPVVAGPGPLYSSSMLTPQLSALFNASVAVFDPYENAITESITFPGLSGDPSLHLGPAAPDPSGRLTILLDAAAAFSTNGQDVSGSNILIKYDFNAKQVVWQLNLTAEVTQGRFGGYQDVAHDKNENVYVVGTFPGTILRVDKDGNGLKGWFLPADLTNTTVAGFGGIESIPAQDILLVNNNADGQLYRFDGVSGSATGTPVLVSRTGTNGTGQAAPLGFSDAILLPAKYNSTVLLVAEDAVGVTVLRSKDGKWMSAETLGTVSNNVPEAMGGQMPASVQIGPNKIFMVEEFFADSPLVAGTNAGNRTSFPMVDVTAQVDALLARFP